MEQFLNKDNEINIAGAGLAGLSAAIHLAKAGIRSNLISMQHSERAQSVLAEGGINGALDTMGEDDSTDEHFKDTLRGGVYLADPEVVRGLVDEAPGIVKWLVDLGVPFQMEAGRLILRNFGGQKKKRTAYAKSSTGKAIVTALIDEARKYEASGLIKRFPHHEITNIEIIKNENGLCCCGLYIKDVYSTDKIFLKGDVILACGGLNGIFPDMTTGTVNNNGRLAARAFAKGIELSGLEFIQYHPTTVAIPGKRMLVSEAARGEGGRLFAYKNGKPWYFMEEKYPELKNLMPRDVVSREMYFCLNDEECAGEIFLDMREIPDETWQQKLSDMHDEIMEHLGIDLKKEPLKVEPGIHFFMGGIKVDKCHKTNADGLYAAGECACIYHGANRLGGNSMLGAIYGGRVAAQNIIGQYSKDIRTNKKNEIENDAPPDENMIKDAIRDDKGYDNEISAVFSKELSKILLSGLGIVRDEETIKDAMAGLEIFEKEYVKNDAQKEIFNLGKAMLISAFERRESRGAHFRSDHPETDDENFKKTTVIYMEDDDIKIRYEPVADVPGCGRA